MESKTALIMANGTLVNTLKALQKNIKNDNDFKQLVEYFLDGKLKDWLNERYGYEKEIKVLEELDKDDPDFTCKLCKAIGIDYTSSEPVNVALIEYEMRIRKALKKVTSENAVIVNAGCTASNQSELDFLIKNGKKIIYLWGDSFKLPLEHNISYIGILGKPSVNIELPNLEAVESYGIKLENVELPESIRKAKEEFDEKIIQLFSELPDLEAAETYGIKLENVKLPEKFNPNPFKNAKVGDIVQIGRYPQTANGDIQPIEWQVLSKEENKMLVISKYGLEARRFDSPSNNWKNREILRWTKWKNSEIRRWTNNVFYSEVFSENEKKYIQPFNGDNVFLLSKEEAEKYFANNESRKCKATDYAKANSADVSANGYSYWWLRSLNNNDSFSDSGYCVMNGSARGLCNWDDGSILVRPALWINLNWQEILDLNVDFTVKVPHYNNQLQKQNSVNSNPFKNVKVGDCVKFGNYQQSANSDILPIEWQVLARENNQVLVISRYGLEARRFDEYSKKWKNSEIRRWLNNGFYDTVFNKEEKKYIQPFDGDNVFLLSKEEAEQYFSDDNARKCQATEYLVINDHRRMYGGCSWWLRSPYFWSNSSVYYVQSLGDINYTLSNDFKIALRPALWINI